MRQESAASVKGKRAHYRLAPREGSRLREIYDAFMAAKGLPVQSPFSPGGRAGAELVQLRDFYGLDIRLVPGSSAGGKGSGRKRTPGKWTLVGEWFGCTYVDYIAERLAKYDREAQP